jgi:hypothetical protein
MTLTIFFFCFPFASLCLLIVVTTSWILGDWFTCGVAMEG